MSAIAASKSPNTPEPAIVDLAAFTSGGDTESCRKVAEELRKKLEPNGFVGISGHGIPDGILKQAFEIVQQFFDLPYGQKMKAPHPSAPLPHRGYSGPGRENTAAKSAKETSDEAKRELYSKTKDFHESFEIGSEENVFEPNIWPPEDVYPGFRHFMIKFYWELNRASMSILEAIIMSLELTDVERDAVRALHTGHSNQLRLLHYPPMEQNKAKDAFVSRMGAHRDWSTFTILFQDSSGGLQFHDRATDAFFDATPMNGVLYMNAGDMLQRLSNGVYPSALHQVAVKDPLAMRYSIPYFFSTTADKVIEPQCSLVKRHGKRNYDPVTIREYSEKAFETINVYE